MAAKTIEWNMLRANAQAVRVRVWIEDGVTRLEGRAAFGYEPISRDEAVEMFGLMQTQALFRAAEKEGEMVP